MADRYCKATKSGVEAVSGLGKRLKWTINSRFALRQPWQAIRNVIWSRIVRPIKHYSLTAGMVMQVVGPDIADKAEVLQEAQKYLNGCFEVRIKQRWIDGGKGGDAQIGERTGWLRHWLRIASCCASLTWRYYAGDRFLPKSVIQFVTVIQVDLYCDGTANVAMNPGRYGFRSAAGLRWMHKLIPRSIEIVLLPESSEQIVTPNGKGEPRFVIEQMHRWRAWAHSGDARNVVLAGESTTETGQRLGHAIVREIEARFGVTQCKKLRPAKRDYDVGEKALS
jgi:hypothetical protein